MQTEITTTNGKPGVLRAVFIMNAIKILISLTFFTIFTLNDIQVGKVGPMMVLYTAFGYMAMFAGIVFSILRKNLIALRIFIALDFLVSIPATAVIGLVISGVSFGLTYNKKLRSYFRQ